MADLKAGRLPASALNRLRDKTAFAAEMSPAEFLALRAAGYEVAGQVFGTATYLVSKSAQKFTRYLVHPDRWSGLARESTPVAYQGFDGGVVYRTPLKVAPRTLAGYHDGVNAARSTALRRLRAECLELGADGVVGIRFVRTGSSGGLTEFTVVGTAVREVEPVGAKNEKPFTTMLTAVEVGALARAGWRPADLLYEHQRYGGHGGYVATGDGGRFNPLSYVNGEVAGASTVVAFATSETRRRLHAGVTAGSGLVLHSVEVSTDAEGCTVISGHTDVLADVEAVATSIVPVATFTVRRERPALQVTPVVGLQ